MCAWERSFSILLANWVNKFRRSLSHFNMFTLTFNIFIMFTVNMFRRPLPHFRETKLTYKKKKSLCILFDEKVGLPHLNAQFNVIFSRPLDLKFLYGTFIFAYIYYSKQAAVDDSFISHGTYDDAVTLRLVQAASDVSGKIVFSLFLVHISIIHRCISFENDILLSHGKAICYVYHVIYSKKYGTLGVVSNVTIQNFFSRYSITNIYTT